MDVIPGALPDYLLWVANGLFALIMLQAIRTAPWHKILDNESSHVFFGTVLLLTVIWLVRSQISGGVSFHIIGATALYLMFQWQFAFFALLLVHGVLWFLGKFDATLLPLNMLILGGIPILLTHVLLKFSQARLPHNFFLYVFVNCFAAAGLSMLLAAGFSFLLYAIFADAAVMQYLQNFVPFAIMIAVPEAAVNGIAMSSLIAYRPMWVATFHDRLYINGK